MKALKAFAMSAAIATASIVAAPATAATIPGTTLDGVTTTEFEFSRLNFTQASFNDTLTFTLTNSGVFDVFLFYLQPSKISAFSATLSGTPGTIFSLSTPGTGGQGNFTQSLAAGTYTLTFSGTTSGAKASYRGGLGLSAVPEPASWALMMMGFGAAGIVLRRRNTKTVLKLA